MRISHAVIVVPGGIGTVLEMFYTWQLMQVAHIRPRPLILFSSDKSWEALIQWTQDYPLKNNLISPKDMEMIKIVNSVDEIMEILDPDIAKFKNEILKQAGQILPGTPD
jgi:predicted Rossmann-fold nucleotide-binding protein